jgi:hypothetical protein
MKNKFYLREKSPKKGKILRGRRDWKNLSNSPEAHSLGGLEIERLENW